jgi:nucleoside phosphorylase
VEMEAAAVGKMSMLLGKQFMAVKAIVDFDDAVGFAGQFDNNFKLATTNLAKQLLNIFAYLANHPVDEQKR